MFNTLYKFNNKITFPSNSWSNMKSNKPHVLIKSYPENLVKPLPNNYYSYCICN